MCQRYFILNATSNKLDCTVYALLDVLHLHFVTSSVHAARVPSPHSWSCKSSDNSNELVLSSKPQVGCSAVSVSFRSMPCSASRALCCVRMA